MDPNQPYQPPQTPAPMPQTPAPLGAPAPQSEMPQASPAPTPPPAQPMPQPQSYQPPQNSWTNPTPATPYPQSPQLPQPHDMSYGATASTPPPRPRSYGKTPLPVRMVEWLKGHWYVPIISLVALLLIGNIVMQVLYPLGALAPGLRVDGQLVGGMEKDKAIERLNAAYGKLQVKLFFGDSTVPYRTPEARKLGIEVDNSSRLAEATYPFALRFVPTSYWWAASTIDVGKPVYNYNRSVLDTYSLSNLGEECIIAPQNATLKLDDNQFTVVSAEPGGKCDMTEFKNAVAKTTYAEGFEVRTDIRAQAAPLTDEIAQQLADELNNNLKNDMPLQAGGTTTNVRSATVKGWLSFRAHVPEDKNDGSETPPPQLLYTIEPERVQRYLETSGVLRKVEKKPGTTRVATTDFTETSRTEGTPGVLVDIKKTVANIDPFVAGRAGKASVIVGPVPAVVKYTRTYTPSDAGYRALIQQFAQDNPGKIGISMTELSGKRPLYSATVNDTTQLPAAGVEGVYLAYAAQAGIEDGSIQKTDQVFGNLSYQDCIEVAISDQDPDCIAGLLGKIGNATVATRMAQIGLTGTTFTGDTTLTTARDMARFMRLLEESELPIKQSSTFRTPMNNVILRSGAHEASDNVRVAGGETESNYNEMVTVTKNGRYVVAIMTEGSEGPETAAKLVRAIDKLRQQKQDLRN